MPNLQTLKSKLFISPKVYRKRSKNKNFSILQLGGNIDPASLNQDRIKRNTTYVSPVGEVFAGIGTGLMNTVTGGAFSPMIKQHLNSQGYQHSDIFESSSGLTQGLTNTAITTMSKGKLRKNIKDDQEISKKIVQYGGNIYQDGGKVLNSNMGLTEIEGPSHYEGGVTLPNSGEGPDIEVEGPETIYTPENYVMSEKMKASKQAIIMTGLPAGFINMSYANISKIVKRNIDTLRPNDKLAKRSMDKIMNKVIQAHEIDREIKKANEYKDIIVQTPEEAAGGYNMYPNAKSIMFPGQDQTTVLPANNRMPIEVTSSDGSQQMLTDRPIQVQAPFLERKMVRGGFLRGDGSDQEDDSFWNSDNSRMYRYGGNLIDPNYEMYVNSPSYYKNLKNYQSGGKLKKIKPLPFISESIKPIPSNFVNIPELKFELPIAPEVIPTESRRPYTLDFDETFKRVYNPQDYEIKKYKDMNTGLTSESAALDHYLDKVFYYGEYPPSISDDPNITHSRMLIHDAMNKYREAAKGNRLLELAVKNYEGQVYADPRYTRTNDPIDRNRNWGEHDPLLVPVPKKYGGKLKPHWVPSKEVLMNQYGYSAEKAQDLIDYDKVNPIFESEKEYNSMDLRKKINRIRNMGQNIYKRTHDYYNEYPYIYDNNSNVPKKYGGKLYYQQDQGYLPNQNEYVMEELYPKDGVLLRNTPEQLINYQSIGLQPIPTYQVINPTFQRNYGKYRFPQKEKKSNYPIYKSSIGNYIAGTIGNVMPAIGNIIAAAASPDATYRPAINLGKIDYTPVSLARQQANQNIASNREAMRNIAPTQGSFLGNMAVSLPTTASSLGNLLAGTRHNIDNINVQIANQEALTRDQIMAQNALIKDQSAAQRWNLGLKGVEGIGKGIKGISKDLELKNSQDNIVSNMKTSDFGLVTMDPNTGQMVISPTGSATYNKLKPIYRNNILIGHYNSVTGEFIEKE